MVVLVSGDACIAVVVDGMCRYEILTVVNVPDSDNADVIDSRLTGVVNSDARVILLYATPSVYVSTIFIRVSSRRQA